MAYATIEDVEALWRALDAAERARAERLLEFASQMILDEVPGAEDRPAATLRRVVSSMVVRAMQTPQGPALESLQEGAGPFQRSVRYANPTGDLFLSAAEKRALRGGVKHRAYEVDLMPESARRGPVWP